MPAARALQTQDRFASTANVGIDPASTDHEPRRNEMYIGGGVLTLILIILLLIWLF